MRYSAIELPLQDPDKVYPNDPEYVKDYTLLSTEGSLDKFIINHNKDLFTYEGKTEQGLERFKFTEAHKKMQVAVMDELIFIPETHPLFNCYTITKVIGVKLFLNITGSLPKKGYLQFQRDIRGSVLATIK